MRSKFEAWIPTLGREVDATKPAWKFDRLLMQSKYEAWMPILDFVEVDATKWKWMQRSGSGFRGSGCDEVN